MVKAVGERVPTGANGFSYEQQLIALCRDALLEDEVVGLVFVNVAKADAQHVTERIPPLKHLYEGEQHDVPRVAALYVSHLMQYNLAACLVVVLLPYHDVPHPAEWRHVIRMAVDADALLVAVPKHALFHTELQAGNLPKTCREKRHHTYYIYETDEEEDAETRDPLTCRTLCQDLHLGQDMNGNAQLEHLQLCRLHDRLVIERHPGYVAEWQDERQEQDSQQNQAIEAEETLAPQHQHVGQVQH